MRAIISKGWSSRMSKADDTATVEIPPECYIVSAWLRLARTNHSHGQYVDWQNPAWVSDKATIRKHIPDMWFALVGCSHKSTLLFIMVALARPGPVWEVCHKKHMLDSFRSLGGMQYSRNTDINQTVVWVRSSLRQTQSPIDQWLQWSILLGFKGT